MNTHIQNTNKQQKTKPQKDKTPMTEYQLVNFKMNPAMKRTFSEVCRENHISATSVLNLLIKDFIAKNPINISKTKNDDYSVLDFYSTEDAQ